MEAARAGPAAGRRSRLRRSTVSTSTTGGSGRHEAPSAPARRSCTSADAACSEPTAARAASAEPGRFDGVARGDRRRQSAACRVDLRLRRGEALAARIGFRGQIRSIHPVARRRPGPAGERVEEVRQPEIARGGEAPAVHGGTRRAAHDEVAERAPASRDGGVQTEAPARQRRGGGELLAVDRRGDRRPLAAQGQRVRRADIDRAVVVPEDTDRAELAGGRTSLDERASAARVELERQVARLAMPCHEAERAGGVGPGGALDDIVRSDGVAGEHRDRPVLAAGPHERRRPAGGRARRRRGARRQDHLIEGLQVLERVREERAARLELSAEPALGR